MNALRLKYVTSNTLAPPSDAAETGTRVHDRHLNENVTYCNLISMQNI